MSFGVIFLILAVGFLGLITVPKLLKKPPVVEPDPKPVRGDELAIWPFAPMPIMTDTEVIFFNKLKSALPEYHIFVQVQLSRIIEGNSSEASERSFWFNRICRQSIDYVIVDIDAQTTLVAIELDDWTHTSKARQRRMTKRQSPC